MLSILIVILGLGLLIGIHEAAHMLVAKLFGVKVLKFSFGFGPRLLSKQIGETSYELRALPLGGFVEFHGDCPESKVKRGFFTLPWYKRSLIALAGPVMNLILGFLIILGLMLTISNYPFMMGVLRATNFCWYVISQTLSWMGTACVGHANMAEMGGPVMVTKIMVDSLKVGMSQFIFVLSIVSLSLGLFNLLPIPSLDGGHVMLYISEKMYGKKLPSKIYMIWNYVGFILLGCLMLFIIYSDIIKLLK